MRFNELLNDYIAKLNCTSKELAETSNVSTALISKYRNNKAVPNMNSIQIKKISKGIYILDINRNIINLSERKILESLINTISKDCVNTDILIKNLNELITIFNISMADMARYLSFDASYLSRIRSGKRTPADPKAFSYQVSSYIIKKYNSDEDKKVIHEIIGTINNEKDNITQLLCNWMSSNMSKSNNFIDDFLKKMDDFNLNEYIKVIHFDEMKVPTLPFSFPTSKNYYGMNQMKNAELDFFKSTVLSKSNNPIYMYSNMPIEDMARDVDFAKKWMFAIALSLKKGLRLNIIHDIDRPFNEMMIGLMSWIPIYMTGQVSPYYLKSNNNNIFHSLNYVSGAAALSGECIDGKHNNGKYYLTNNKEEIKYYQKKADDLFDKVHSLIQIYKEDSKSTYYAYLSAEFKEKGSWHNILCNLPIYTMNKKLLNKILHDNKINNKDIILINKFYDEQVKIANEILINNDILEEINILNKDEFNKNNAYLSLSQMFYNKRIKYTYDQYLKHIESTKEFKKKNKHYNIELNKNIVFKNIQIYIRDGKWVMLSKDDNPTIHFIIKHPKLCTAIENFIVPIKED